MALVLAAVLSLRGADRALLGGLENAGFDWEPAIALAMLTSGLTAAAAAWLGTWLATLAPATALSIGIGAGLLALARFATPPRQLTLREPTRSIFAFAMVLVIVQSVDAVRLATLALGAVTREPLLVACGAFLGAPIGLAQPPGSIDRVDR